MDSAAKVIPIRTLAVTKQSSKIVCDHVNTEKSTTYKGKQVCSSCLTVLD